MLRWALELCLVQDFQCAHRILACLRDSCIGLNMYVPVLKLIDIICLYLNIYTVHWNVLFEYLAITAAFCIKAGVSIFLI